MDHYGYSQYGYGQYDYGQYGYGDDGASYETTDSASEAQCIVDGEWSTASGRLLRCISDGFRDHGYYAGAYAAPPALTSSAEAVLAVPALAERIVHFLAATADAPADFVNFELVCKALHNARHVLTSAHWRALCERVSPATARALPKANWRRLARALHVNALKQRLRWPMGAHTLCVDVRFRGALLCSSTFSLRSPDYSYGGEGDFDDVVAPWIAQQKDYVVHPLVLSPDEVFADAAGGGGFSYGGHSYYARDAAARASPFRANAWLVRKDNAVARLVDDLPPSSHPLRRPQQGTTAASQLTFNLEEQLKNRVGGASIGGRYHDDGDYGDDGPPTVPFSSLRLTVGLVIQAAGTDSGAPCVVVDQEPREVTTDHVAGHWGSCTDVRGPELSFSLACYDVSRAEDMLSSMQWEQA